MDLNNLTGLLAFTGTLVQCAVAFLTVLLFALLGRYAARRAYFSAWTAAWAVLLLSILALVVRYYIVPNFDRTSLESLPSITVRTLYFVYEFGKLLFATLLVHGTLLFLDDRRASRFLAYALPVITVFAVTTVLIATSLNEIVAWQSSLIAAAAGYCCVRLIRMEATRRSLGTRLVGGCFGLMAALWVIYLVTFTRVAIVGGAAGPYPSSLFTVNNSFIDTLVAMLLTMGMMVLLMEDATRETERLRAEQQVALANADRMETVGRLVSGIAHELNNPLTAVLSFSEILLHEPRVEHDRLALSTIREQARRCRSVVRNLLTFVREGPIHRQPVVLPEALERVVKTFEPELAQFGITCTVDVPAELPVLEVDAEGLDQVLTNLMSNSIHGIGRFGHITIRAVDSGVWVTVAVEDDGSGIPADVLPHIFEPFVGSRTSGRTGLGLSVSQGIVSAHGGSLKAENRTPPEKGARLIFTLPVLPRELVAPAGRTPVPPPASSLTLPAGKRALLIEDEKAIRSAIRRFLEKAGWEVVDVEAARPALDLLLEASTSRPFDLVISDLRMPDMSGIELHNRLLKSHPRLLDRFIFVTGDVASPEAAAFLGQTTCPVLEKPFELQALVKAIQATLGRHG
jgi:signal transduction histidine kinase/ActR/RegA family two-component response regulator